MEGLPFAIPAKPEQPPVSLGATIEPANVRGFFITLELIFGSLTIPGVPVWSGQRSALDRDGLAAKLAAMPKVEIYTTVFCPYCERAKALLARKGVAFEETDAPHGSQARKDAIARSGGRTTVPQIFIDGQPVGGSDELAALERAGKLDPLLSA
jgi:glutaredoxin 3